MKKNRSTKEWGRNDESMQKGMVRFSQEVNPYKMNLIGQINEELEEWLDTTANEPRDLATLTSAIIDGFGKCSRISAMSSFKFILTFPTLEAMQDALPNQDQLNLWFVDVRKWSVYYTCDTRRVWLDIFGIPPHGWKWDNFKNIVEIWGRFICLGKSTSHTESFKVMKVRIYSRRLNRRFLLHWAILGNDQGSGNR